MLRLCGQLLRQASSRSLSTYLLPRQAVLYVINQKVRKKASFVGETRIEMKLVERFVCI